MNCDIHYPGTEPVSIWNMYWLWFLVFGAHNLPVITCNQYTLILTTCSISLSSFWESLMLFMRRFLHPLLQARRQSTDGEAVRISGRLEMLPSGGVDGCYWRNQLSIWSACGTFAEAVSALKTITQCPKQSGCACCICDPFVGVEIISGTDLVAVNRHKNDWQPLCL